MKHARIACLGICLAASFFSATAQKTGLAVRTESPVKVDALAEEADWSKAPLLTDFIQNSPVPGVAPKFQTQVRVMYDDEAFYLFADMWDPNPDSIPHQLTNRDDFGNTDFFGITLSCFRDGLNGVYFGVTPDGVQMDILMSPETWDDAWNAVWFSKARIHEKGWSAEFMIPYSAFRFPKKSEQEWDINFERNNRRYREMSYWNEVKPEIEGEFNQSGILRGINNITPPPRLFFYPYASTYVERAPDGKGGFSSGFQWNAGMDVKYGLTDAFTLDMTLVPDFGQVQFDQFVLNLSPFEVRFNENRQFFLEGTELFSKGDLFYSRRIGGTPVGYFDVFGQMNDGDSLISNPGDSRLINASKISGRTGSGLGIGFFNAVTAPAHAVVRDSLGNDRQIETNPLTNYNILVLDQNLNKNSYVTLINTNVMRAGGFYDANVTGLRLQLRDKKNQYGISGGGAYSKLFTPDPNPTDDGYTYDVRVGKVSGNFLFGVATQLYSPDYDPSDLGFLYNNNEVNYYAYTNINRYKPFGPFNRAWVNASTGFNRGVDPNELYSIYGNVNGGIFDKYFNAYGFNINSNPFGSFDYFDPRIPGYFIKQPASSSFGGWYSSDYRKKVALDINYYYTDFDAPGREAHTVGFGPRWRVSDRLMLIYGMNVYRQHKQLGFAFLADEETSVFGHRDLTTHTQTLTASYIFTNSMGLTCRARHYWSKAEYLKFEKLLKDGTTELIDQTPYFDENGRTTRDLSFNSFTVDLVFRWVFLPGSEMNVVWKNSIIGFSQEIPESVTANISDTFVQPATNSFSIKVLYFLDYLRLKSAVAPKHNP